MWLDAVLAVAVAVGAPAHAAPARTFLALGDSYTIGEGVAAQMRWPVQLAARLRAGGVELAEPQIIARTGWTTGDLSVALDQAALHPPYALVTLLIGVNNHYRGLPLEAYREQFHTLLKRAVALAGGDAHHVIVVSIPDWGVTPFARGEGRDAAQVAQQIDAFNTAARTETSRAHAHWVDVTGISRARGTRGLLTGDGLHPSAAQYALWGGAIEPMARQALAH